MRLVDNVKTAWRWLSMQFMAAAVAIQTAWLSLPDELKASIPPKAVSAITIGLLILGMLGRLKKQEGDK